MSGLSLRHQFIGSELPFEHKSSFSDLFGAGSRSYEDVMTTSPASEPASQTSSSTSCAGGGLLARLSRTPFCYVPGLRVRRRGLRLRRLEDGTRRLCFYVSLFSWFSLELPCFGEFSVFALGGFSPSHWATHVLPKCPSYQEETYAKETGETRASWPTRRQVTTLRRHRPERVGPRAE